jgi:NodT family efflux transporter outer membrane factor (OMF) lipoprotein
MASALSSPSLENATQIATSSGCTEFISLTEKWWEIFEDPQLNTLIEQSLSMNPTLQKANAQVLQAQAEAKMVRSHLFPHLSASAQENWQYLSKYGLLRDFFPAVPGFPISHKFNETNFSLGFSYEVDFFGKNQKMLQAALGRALAEEMERRQAELILCTTVCFTYFSLQAHLAELDLYQKQLICEEALFKLTENRHTSGIDNVVDSLLNTQKISSLKQTIEETKKEIIVDGAFLEELLGVGPSSLSIQFVWNPTAIASYLPNTLNIDLLARRPDLMAQKYRVEAARQDVGVAKTEFYPNVNLMALGGFSSLSFSHLFEWKSRTGTLRPAIHLPLFTGGYLEGNLSEKVAKFNQAIFDYNALILESAKEVISEVSTFVSLHNQILEQQKKLSAQEQLYEVANVSYTVGTKNYSAPLYEEKALLSYQLEATSLYQYKILSFLRVIKALGGGWGEEQ